MPDMESPVSAAGSDHSAASTSSTANNNNNGVGGGLKQRPANEASSPQHSPQPTHCQENNPGDNTGSPMMRAGPPGAHGGQGMQQQQQQHGMQMTPPPVSTPNGLGGLGGRLGHLPPPGLGLLNSLQMMHHASPLELMAVAQHHHGGPPRSYNSPPPISSSDPAANECKLVDYRGQKVAAFIISGETMLCLPQAFELFLKHLVGGLHTVYTKLKRLDIVPLVCNVEQVRILRGLGAIQPGVNRCKLLSCKDFDVLYRDCTTARCLSIKAPERPGRPPKRASVGLSLAATHLAGSLGGHHHQLKKHRPDGSDYPPYENGHVMSSEYISRLEKSPLLANGYNAPPTHLNHMQFMQQLSHHNSHHNPHAAAAAAAAMLSPHHNPHHPGGHHVPRPDGSVPAMLKGLPPGAPPGSMEALARSGIWENCRVAYEDIVKHLERLREERGDMDRALALDHKPRDLSSQNGEYYDGSSNGHSPVLNLSKGGGGGGSDRSEGACSPGASVPDGERLGDASDIDQSDAEDQVDKKEDMSDADERDTPLPLPLALVPSHPSSTGHRASSSPARDDSEESSQQAALNYSAVGASLALQPPAGVPAGAVPQEPGAPPACSTETLLRNIQGLLKVAADNARQQERQISYEKAELKMDVLREREVKDSLERQLMDEQKARAVYQRRFKRERRFRLRLQERLDAEEKRRVQLEDALRTGAGVAPASSAQQGGSQQNNKTDGLRCVNDSGSVAASESRPESPYAVSGGGANVPTSRDGGSQPSQAPVVATSNPGPSPTANVPLNDRKPTVAAAGPWQGYAGLDLVTSGAAFWQNYSESLAQELELERKARQQQNVDGDVKSPLQDRTGYYKNSVLFSSAT